ncbi:hypothetical protein A0J61_10030 [Choanephora cucurbitarum]|uniref:Uncharacterized protein n=1 Tax=Choanephora cucurbitarum TaxID=101091 RepID=A0A1C7MYK5_9FUNG|nr:hypothetical protein A0J61_10030 [Choanephora cucurbitarum]
MPVFKDDLEQSSLRLMITRSALIHSKGEKLNEIECILFPLRNDSQTHETIFTLSLKIDVPFSTVYRVVASLLSNEALNPIMVVLS